MSDSLDQQNNQDIIKLTEEQKQELEDKNQQEDLEQLHKIIDTINSDIGLKESLAKNNGDEFQIIQLEMYKDFINDVNEIVKDGVLNKVEKGRLDSIDTIITHITNNKINSKNIGSIEDEKIRDIQSLKSLVFSRELLTPLGIGGENLKLVLNLIYEIGSSNIDEKKLKEINVLIKDIFDGGINHFVVNPDNDTDKANNVMNMSDVENMQKLQSLLLVAYNIETKKDLKTYNISVEEKEDKINNLNSEIKDFNPELYRKKIESLNISLKDKRIKLGKEISRLKKYQDETGNLGDNLKIDMIKHDISYEENYILRLEDTLGKKEQNTKDVDNETDNTQKTLDLIYDLDKKYGDKFNEISPTLGKFLDSVALEVKEGFTDGDINSLGGAMKGIFEDFDKIFNDFDKIDIKNPSTITDFISKINGFDLLNFSRFASSKILNLLFIGIKEFKNYFIKANGSREEHGVLVQYLKEHGDEIKGSKSYFAIWNIIKNEAVDKIDRDLTTGLNLINPIFDAVLDSLSVAANIILVPDQVIGNIKEAIGNIDIQEIIDSITGSFEGEISFEDLMDLQYLIVYVITYTIMPFKAVGGLKNIISKLTSKMSGGLKKVINSSDNLLGGHLKKISNSKQILGLKSTLEKVSNSDKVLKVKFVGNKVEEKINKYKPLNKNKTKPSNNTDFVGKIDNVSGKIGKYTSAFSGGENSSQQNILNAS